MAALAIEVEGLAKPDWRAALPILANDRVTLRELTLSDAAELHRIVQCPDVARYMWPAPTGIDLFERFIEWTWSERAAGKYLGFGIVPYGATDAAGLFELRQMQPGFARAELGFFIDPAFWGQGVFTEAARLMLQFAFSFVGVHRIEARASANNLRGNMALQKLGARKEGVLRAAFFCDGTYVDQYLWSIVAGLDITR